MPISARRLLPVLGTYARSSCRPRHAEAQTTRLRVGRNDLWCQLAPISPPRGPWWCVDAPPRVSASRHPKHVKARRRAAWGCFALTQYFGPVTPILRSRSRRASRRRSAHPEVDIRPCSGRVDSVVAIPTSGVGSLTIDRPRRINRRLAGTSSITTAPVPETE